jgi:hypothetical protein
MKKRLPAGLLVEGNATASQLLRMPGLVNQIGPVKSTDLRVARRFSNGLRAGHAVASYEELQESSLVLIRVPDDSLARVAEEICKSDLALRRMCFAVCETWAPSSMLSALREAGASVTTLLLISEPESACFVAEGDLSAVRQVRNLVETSGGRVLQIRSGYKSLYFTADLLATTLPIPFLIAAQASLRQAGLSGKLLSSVLNQFSGKLLRNLKAGSRVASLGTMAAVSPEICAAYLADASEKMPEIAMMLDEHLPRNRESVSEI